MADYFLAQQSHQLSSIKQEFLSPSTAASDFSQSSDLKVYRRESASDIFDILNNNRSNTAGWWFAFSKLFLWPPQSECQVGCSHVEVAAVK